MNQFLRKHSLLVALVCSAFMVQGQTTVSNPSNSTFEVRLNTTTGANTAVDHLILGTEVTTASNPIGIGPESTSPSSNHEWYVSGGADLHISYDDVLDTRPRVPLFQLDPSQMIGHVDQFKIANNNILVNASGVSFSGDNLQLGSSLNADALGLIVHGNSLSVGSSLTADANGLAVVGSNLSVGSKFQVNDAATRLSNELIVMGQDFTVGHVDPNTQDEVNEFRVTPAGVVTAREVNVNTGLIPDYVFEPDYELLSIEELDVYIQEHGHLPNIKSAEEYEAIGTVDLGELNLKLLEKVEELSLYTIDLQAQVKDLKAELEALKGE